MITLLGTGHVFNLRERVQREIYQRAPGIVAIELDPPRMRALMQPNAEKGKGPLFYRLLAQFQTRIAEAYGVQAGDEMLAAAEAARVIGVPVALIDRDAQKTFQRLLKEMGFLEKTRLLGSAVGSLFVPSKSIESQVSEMEDDYSSYFEILGEKFPTVKRVLLDERNTHMASAIRQLSEQYSDLVVVMGDGHVDGVTAILSKDGITVEALRLKELRQNAQPEGGVSYSMSVTQDAAPPPERPAPFLDGDGPAP